MYKRIAYIEMKEGANAYILLDGRIAILRWLTNQSRKGIAVRFFHGLTNGAICRVAQSDNLSGCGAKGTLHKNDNGTWTLISMYPINPNVTFTEDEIGYQNSFSDADGTPSYPRFQLR